MRKVKSCSTKSRCQHRFIKKPLFRSKSVRVPKYATKCCPGYTGSKCLQATINTQSIVLNRSYRDLSAKDTKRGKGRKREKCVKERCRGDKGDTGPPGPMGPAGPQGPSGKDGFFSDMEEFTRAVNSVVEQKINELKE